MSRSVVSLRAHQKAVTTEIILEAVSRCLEDTELTDLSFARVAAAAGIGERTIYRHFPNKEALLSAWWRYHKAKIGQEEFPDTAAALIDFPRRAFPLFDDEAMLMRGAVLSTQGREITLQANEARQAAMRKAVRDGVGNGIAEPELTAFCAVVQLLQSATAWLTMKDYWGLSGIEAGQASANAIATLFEAWRNQHCKPNGDTE